MSPYIFGLIAHLGWGTGDIFGAIASRKIGGYKTTFWILAAAALLFAPLVPIYWHLLSETTPLVILSAVIMGFFYVSGNFAINEALRKADASIVLTINGSFGALVVLFSSLFLHESISIQLTLIIIAIFIGVFLCTFDPTSVHKHNKSTGIWLAIYASISFGIFFTGVKFFASSLQWFWPIYLSFLWLPIIYLYLLRIHQRPSINDVRASFTPLIWNLLLLRGGDFVFNIGLQTSLATIVAPIASASPTLSVILAVIVFREKPTKRQLLGILIALTGIVALGLTQ